MKNFTSRRSFLQKTSLTITGLAFLSNIPQLHAFTEDGAPFKGYNPFAEENNDLRTGTFFEKNVTVNGKIYDSSGQNPIKDALVEVWHLSPNTLKYRHRGKIKTNEAGEYSFISDFPGKEKGKNSRIYFKITKGETISFTELIVSPYDAHITGTHWENNNQLKENLFPKHNTFLNQTTIQFNISL